MDIVWYIGPFIVLMVVLVVVHELGHYLAARSLGIRATHFSVGMGPLLFSVRDKAGCAWQLRAFPVGGYVRMLGDADASSGKAEGEGAPSSLSEEDRGRCFHLRPTHHRAWVIFAGPFANFILGAALIAGIYMSVGRSYTAPLASGVTSGSPAQIAGIREGDRFIAVNGRAIERFEDVQAEVSLHPGKPLKFAIQRKGISEVVVFVVVPDAVLMENVFGTRSAIGRIGVSSGIAERQEIGPLGAVYYGVTDSYHMTVGALSALGDILTGLRPIDEMGGPVKIAEMSGNAAKAGWLILVYLAAALSLNLGIMNLLPIPVLDGGHLVLIGLEATFRRPMNEKVVAWAFRGGMAVLLALFAVVSFNDVLGLIQRTSLWPT